MTASRNDRIDALIPQGALIRGVLETAIQSDLPGMVRAVISTDVCSFDGRRILLPKGTMLTGEYKSGMARGQTRVLIVWTRALRSDGTSVALGSYGTDDLGRSGLTGFVDKHYLERFGAAAVLSMVGGVSSLYRWPEQRWIQQLWCVVFNEFGRANPGAADPVPDDG
ncbi:TrbI/VirB10 family protein [Rhizobium beringeri]